MREQDAARLIASGLYIPGMSETDHVELIKARQMRHPLDSSNRGSYMSDFGDNWSYWGAGSPDRKPATSVAFQTLRQKYESSPIDKLIIMRRQMQVRRVAQRCLVPGKQTGFRVVHERHADPTFVPDESTIERCALMERLICNVARDVCRDVKQFSSMMIKEELTVDRKAMLLFLDDTTNKPISYAPMDGTSIIPRIAVLLPFMAKRGIKDFEQAAELMSDDLRSRGIVDAGGKQIDVTKAAWVQVINEEIKGAWTKDEMSVDITNRDIAIDQLLYGKSCLEQSLELTDLFINAMMYNMNIFSPNFPEGLIVITGAYDKAGIEGFKRTVLMQTNSSGAQRIPVIPGDDQTFKVEWQKLRETPKDALFTELLRLVIALKTAAYGMHPSEINFSPDGGGASAMINENDEGAAQEAATADGLNSALDNLGFWWCDALIRKYYDDLVVIWDGLNTDDETGRVDLNVKKVESYRSLSEVRGTENAEQMVIPEDLSKIDPMNMPLNATLVQLLNIKMQAQQLAMQQQQMANMPPADPNADYGEEDADNWHTAGQEPVQDMGQEPENWMFDGQVDKNGEPVKLQKPQQAKPMNKSHKTMKYIRLVLDEDEG